MKRQDQHTKWPWRKKPVLLIPTREGVREIAVPDFRQASQVGRYWNAVKRYLETGDSSAIEKFRGKSITDARGTEIPLLTDLEQLDRLAGAGVLSFETIYARR